MCQGRTGFVPRTNHPGSCERQPDQEYDNVLDIFETPVTVTPPTGNFKNSKFFQNARSILNVYFWGEITFTFFWGGGESCLLWGNKVYYRRFSKISGFWNILFVAGGGFGTVGVGGVL